LALRWILQRRFQSRRCHRQQYDHTPIPPVITGIVDCSATQLGARPAPTAWESACRNVFIPLRQHLVHQRGDRELSIACHGPPAGKAATLSSAPCSDDSFTVAPLVRQVSFSAAQNRPRCRFFQAQRRDIDRHVRTGFINHADHTERYAATPQDVNRCRSSPPSITCPTGSARLHTLANIVGDTFQTCWRQRQAVEHCFAQAVFTRFS